MIFGFLCTDLLGLSVYGFHLRMSSNFDWMLDIVIFRLFCDIFCSIPLNHVGLTSDSHLRYLRIILALWRFVLKSLRVSLEWTSLMDRVKPMLRYTFFLSLPNASAVPTLMRS